MQRWYATVTNKGSPHEQGLVIDETTGANVAVTYDPRHAALIARAPALAAALEKLLEAASESDVNPWEAINEARDLLNSITLED